MEKNTYKIQKGDTLSGLAKTYGTDVNTLASLNKGNTGAIPDLNNLDLILEGGTLNIPGENKMITTSGPARAETAMYSNELDKALKGVGVTNPLAANDPAEPIKNGVPNENNSDPMMSMLNKMEITSNDSTRAIIGSIRAAKQNNVNSVNKQYDTYKRGLQLLGIQSGMSESSPDILLSHINQAESEHQQKLQALDGEEAKAIMDAENARTEKNFALFKEKMAYVRQIKQDKQNEMKNLYDTLTATKGIADIQAQQIYDTLATMNPADKEIFLQRVAEKFKLPLSALVAAVADVKINRAKDARDEARKDYATYKRGGDSDELDFSGDFGVATKTYTVSAKGRRRLNRNDIDDKNISEIEQYLTAGGTMTDFLAGNPDLTNRQKRLIQEYFIGQ